MNSIQELTEIIEDVCLQQGRPAPRVVPVASTLDHELVWPDGTTVPVMFFDTQVLDDPEKVVAYVSSLLSYG